MPKFKSLVAIQAHLEKNVHLIMNRSAELERELANVMSQAVVDVVYGHYSPDVYERRGDNDGLSDVRNMSISSVSVENGKIKLIFENLTEGADSQYGVFITDMIESGDDEMWSNPAGKWADRREFVAETARRLKENPEGMLNAIRSGLISKGFYVK